MANIRSAQKHIRADAKKTERNRSRKTEVQTSVRRAREALDGKHAETARVEVLKAVSKLDRAAEKGVIHRNNASRRKGSIMRSLAALESET